MLLEVSDPGVGMEESTKAQIFEPFFTTREFGKRTSLGPAGSSFRETVQVGRAAAKGASGAGLAGGRG